MTTPQKLSVKLRNGKCELEVKAVPDLDEAKRLWMSGKSAQYILEQAKRRAKSEHDE